jgi:hypothetical protein
LPEVSSTQVRTAIARGDWAAVERVVPRAVVEYARSRNLYAAAE